jgi:hypothetical protein
MQTSHLMLGCSEIASTSCVDAFDELAVLVASMIHDFKVSVCCSSAELALTSRHWMSHLVCVCSTPA